MSDKLKSLSLFAVFFLSVTFAFTAAAHAANAMDPVDGSLDVARAVYDAMHAGHYAFAAATALVVAVALIRKYLGGRWVVLHTDAGAACLVLAGSFGSAVAAATAGGGPVTWGLMCSAGAVAFAAAGGYATLKSLVVDPLVASGRLPAWVEVVVSYLFVHASDPANQPAPAPVAAARRRK